MKLESCRLADYHKRAEPSPSILCYAVKGLADLCCYMDDRDNFIPSDEMNLGTFVHDWIENKGILPDCWVKEFDTYKVGNKSRGVSAGDPKLDKSGNPLYFYRHEIDDSLSLTPASSRRADELISSMGQSHVIQDLFKRDLEVEPSFVTNMSGINIRIRPDMIDHQKKEVWEIKTAQNWSARAFSRQVFDLSYDLQAFCELYGIKQELGSDYRAINFLVIGTGRPNAVWVYRLEDTDDQLLVGQYKFDESLDTWKKYLGGERITYREGSGDLPLSYDAMDYKLKKENL